MTLQFYDYIIKETKAPDGYDLAYEEMYQILYDTYGGRPIRYSKSGKLHTISGNPLSNTYQVVFANTIKKGNLQLIKASANEDITNDNNWDIFSCSIITYL